MTVWRGWGASADGSLPAAARQPPAVIAGEKPRTAKAAVRATRWLDRLAGERYSNKDPSVTYYYDQASYNGLTISNGKGQRTGMSDGSGQTAWSYDTMGRIVAEQRTIASVTKTMSYSRCTEPPEHGHQPSHQRQLLLGSELRLRSLRKPDDD